MSAVFFIARLQCARARKYALLRSVAVRTLTVHRAKDLATNAPSASRRSRRFARGQNLNLKHLLSGPSAGDYVLTGTSIFVAGWLCYYGYLQLPTIEDIRRILRWPEFTTDWQWPRSVKDWVWPESEKDGVKSESTNAHSEESIFKKAASVASVIWLPMFLCITYPDLMLLIIAPWRFCAGALIAAGCMIGVGRLFRDA